MSILNKIGITKGRSKSADIFEKLTGSKSFLDLEDMTPSEYVSFYWEKYQNYSTAKSNNSLNGIIFELIIYTLLYRENLLPFYTQASVAFVPGIIYDTILYTKERPICLSLKTSLRERYKQADLESIALKYVHRKAKCYILTTNEAEADNVNKKIQEGTVIGINKAIYCLSSEIDSFINALKDNKKFLCKAGKIDIIQGNIIEHQDGIIRK